jgi:hypothetical protein
MSASILKLQRHRLSALELARSHDRCNLPMSEDDSYSSVITVDLGVSTGPISSYGLVREILAMPLIFSATPTWPPAFVAHFVLLHRSADGPDHLLLFSHSVPCVQR